MTIRWMERRGGFAVAVIVIAIVAGFLIWPTIRWLMP
jgi:hypothetical protein